VHDDNLLDNAGKKFCIASCSRFRQLIKMSVLQIVTETLHFGVASWKKQTVVS